jgi:hypothetical protein
LPAGQFAAHFLVVNPSKFPYVPGGHYNKQYLTSIQIISTNIRTNLQSSGDSAATLSLYFPTGQPAVQPELISPSVAPYLPLGHGLQSPIRVTVTDEGD